MILLLLGCEAVVDLTPEHPQQGLWSGELDAFVEFVGGQDDAYCVGEVQAEVDPFGVLIGSVSCSLMWGPYPGETLSGSVEGLIEHDRYALDLRLEADERRFQDTHFEGAVDDPLAMQADTVYEASTGATHDASIELRLFQ